VNTQCLRIRKNLRHNEPVRTRPNSSVRRTAVRSGLADLRSFESIGQPRAHEYVADLIRRQIGIGLLAHGAALPPERELARQLGVGRATIQLAIGLLEADQLVETRRGRAGGTFVVAPAPGTRAFAQRILEATYAVDVIADAIEYRLMVEPAAARAAATGGTTRELRAIERANHETAEASEDAEVIRFDSAFHLAVARASHNRFICEAVEQCRLHLNSVLLLLPESEAFHDASNVEHARIVKAIVGRNAEAAEKHMLAHVDRSARNLRAFLRFLRDSAPRGVEDRTSLDKSIRSIL
jgi:DNA-binding FadR family transcriptional regulator